jgi:hypothetical protein
MLISHPLGRAQPTSKGPLRRPKNGLSYCARPLCRRTHGRQWQGATGGLSTTPTDASRGSFQTGERGERMSFFTDRRMGSRTPERRTATMQAAKSQSHPPLCLRTGAAPQRVSRAALNDFLSVFGGKNMLNPRERPMELSANCCRWQASIRSSAVSPKRTFVSSMAFEVTITPHRRSSRPFPTCLLPAAIVRIERRSTRRQRPCGCLGCSCDKKRRSVRSAALG